MDQDEAVSVIYSLIPKMVGKDAAGEIIKYAAANGLAPAQLQRLGYVFNQAMTNAMLEKDRNGSPSLVDVTKMASDYIAVTGRAKRANSFLDEDAPVMKTASAVATPSINRDRVPEAWEVKERGFVKEAAAPVRDRTRDAFWLSIKVANVAFEEYSESFLKCSSVVGEVARQVSKQANPSMHLAMLREDVRRQIPGEDANIDDVIAKIAAAVGKEADRYNEVTPPASVFSSDRTGLIPRIHQGIGYTKQASFAYGGLIEAVATAGETGARLAADPLVVRASVKLATEIQRLGKPLGMVKESGTAQKVVEGPWGPSREKEEDFGSRAELMADRAGESAKREEGTLPFIAPALSAGAYGITHMGQKGRELLFRDAPSALREFTTQGTIGQMLEETARKNKVKSDGRLLDRDRIEKDTMAVANLQRVLIEDEILSKKDPEKVFEMFQTIRNASPEVAGDPSMLRLMLRHAMETQGVDIDTASAARKFEHGSYRSEVHPNGPPRQSSEPDKRRQA